MIVNKKQKSRRNIIDKTNRSTFLLLTLLFLIFWAANEQENTTYDRLNKKMMSANTLCEDIQVTPLQKQPSNLILFKSVWPTCVSPTSLWNRVHFTKS